MNLLPLPFLISILELSDATVYEPSMRALLGTASHICEIVVLENVSSPGQNVVVSVLRVPHSFDSRALGAADRLVLSLQVNDVLGSVVENWLLRTVRSGRFAMSFSTTYPETSFKCKFKTNHSAVYSIEWTNRPGRILYEKSFNFKNFWR